MGTDGEAIRSWCLIDLDCPVVGNHTLVQHRLNVRTAHVCTAHDRERRLVLGVEAIEGTDALLRRCGELRRDGPGGVLVKLEKPGQERRVDRPTIGPQTVALAAATGLRGIAAEAGATLVLDRDEVVLAADAAGLFVVGIRAL